jgi:outer membrane biosynthesis protein TonB
MKETEMHMFAGLGTIVLCAAVVVPPTLLGGSASAGPDIDLSQMESIEAELAMKSETAPRQPQKEKRAPDPIIEEKIGGDAQAKAETCKADADCTAGQICKNGQCVKDPKSKAKPEDDPIDLSKFKHNTDDDAEVGEQKPVQLGSFDGSEYGWAPTNKGDPFYVDFIRDLRAVWEYPEIASDEGEPAGCFHLEPDGKISAIEFKTPSGNPELDDSVQRAMAAVQKQRNDNPVAVPTHLLQQGVTTRWLCIRFKPKAS